MYSIRIKYKTSKKKIYSDLEIVKAEARHLVILDHENIATYQENPLGNLNVIAVIGPVNSSSHGYFAQALLCEIGISHTRPYCQARVPKHVIASCSHENKPRFIKERKRIFSLSESQYLSVAPLLFSIIKEITEQAVAKRKVNITNPYKMRIIGNHWSKKKNGLIEKDKVVCIETGIHFSLNKCDDFLVNDIHWAELYGNKVLEKQLRGFANKISFPLRYYYKSRAKKRLQDLPKYAQILEIASLDFFPHYLKIRMLDFIKTNIKNYFRNDLHALVCWDGRQTTQQRIASKSLPNPKSRLCGVRLRIKYAHKDPSIYVFEAYADNHREEFSPCCCEESEVPF